MPHIVNRLIQKALLFFRIGGTQKRFCLAAAALALFTVAAPARAATLDLTFAGT